MENERFSRTQALLGESGMQRLHEARIAVFGLGGVGTSTAEYLSRSGAGHLWLFDFDRITPSSCNRLLTAGTSTLGMEKAAAMRARILDINPRAEVSAEALFLGPENAAEVLAAGKFDLVIDAIDSLNPKTSLLEAAIRGGHPVISSMGAAARTDPSRVVTGTIWETRNCPLATKVRQGLRRRGITAAIPVVFSPESPAAPLPPESDNAADANLRYPRGRVRNIQPSCVWIPAVFAAHLMRLALTVLGVK
ncbi:MAG TPA: tRNA threonylcarbamoyladenosine dehydratase [Spirochaetota bacterium]|nr:tRNA threonylcarbamoyladenosine dehydratase [Spirochaetota bacterium]HPH02883.1 tRNA threonylcarbamoyladenosine dehydratase [Spirochaetota bacterium]